MKTTKVLDICESGYWFVCIKDNTAKANPYRLYLKWYDAEKGYRQKLLAKYSDFVSILCAIKDFYIKQQF